MAFPDIFRHQRVTLLRAKMAYKCFKKRVTTLKAYINLFRGHV
jgi:hypothetical protein